MFLTTVSMASEVGYVPKSHIIQFSISSQQVVPSSGGATTVQVTAPFNIAGLTPNPPGGLTSAPGHQTVSLGGHQQLHQQHQNPAIPGNLVPTQPASLAMAVKSEPPRSKFHFPFTGLNSHAKN